MLGNTNFVGYIGVSNTNSCVVPYGVSLRPVPLTGSDTAPPEWMFSACSAPAQNLRLMLGGGLEAVTLLYEWPEPA